jgi:hypothetical protein
MRVAVRTIPFLAVAAIAAAGPLPGGAGIAQTTPPQITLLAPANGAIVEDSPEKPNAVEFKWRVDWSQPPAVGAVIVSVKWATDPGFTENVSGGNQTCPATNVNCWTSFSPNHTWKGRYYWKVTVASEQPAESATWMFTGVEAPPQPDRTRPYVRTFSGSAKRGKRAFFSARVRDNKGEVRMRAVLSYRARPVLEGRTRFAPVAWSVRQRFYSIRPLPRQLPAGIYKICITAWDRAGNQGRSCARYRVL